MSAEQEWPNGRGTRVTGDPQFRSIFIGAGEWLTAAPNVVPYEGGLFNVDAEGQGWNEVSMVIAADIDLGELELFHEALAGPPAALEAGWWDVSEVSLRWLNEGPLGLDLGPAVPVEPDGAIRLDSRGHGWYRVRAHAIGHDYWHPRRVEGRMPRYFLQSWPEETWREGIVLLNGTWLDPEDEHAVPPAVPRPIQTDPSWTPSEAESQQNDGQGPHDPQDRPQQETAGSVPGIDPVDLPSGHHAGLMAFAREQGPIEQRPEQHPGTP